MALSQLLLEEDSGFFKIQLRPGSVSPYSSSYFTWIYCVQYLTPKGTNGDDPVVTSSVFMIVMR